MLGLREKPAVGVSGVDSSLDSHQPIVAETPEKTRNMILRSRLLPGIPSTLVRGQAESQRGIKGDNALLVSAGNSRCFPRSRRSGQTNATKEQAGSEIISLKIATMCPYQDDTIKANTN